MRPVFEAGHACPYCADTGRRPGSNYLDCGHCQVAQQRADLEKWLAALPLGLSPEDEAWAIYQRGQASGAEGHP